MRGDRRINSISGQRRCHSKPHNRMDSLDLLRKHLEVGWAGRGHQATLRREPSGPPAWKTIPTWAVIGTADKVIPPALLQSMAQRAGAHITDVNAGHLSLISRANTVTTVTLTGPCTPRSCAIQGTRALLRNASGQPSGRDSGQTLR
jgi:pimeloyl-ACP methyl ester carboxylesterase